MKRVLVFGMAMFLGLQAGCNRAAILPTERRAILARQQFANDTPSYWPTSGWRESSPEEQGMNSLALMKAIEIARQKALPIHNLLIVRHGVVVLDASFYPFADFSRHDVASITKSVTSLLIGAAVERGVFPDPQAHVLDILKRQPRKQNSRKMSMSVANLLGMQSGLECGYARGEIELRAMKKSSDWVQYLVDLPARSGPGTEFGYCSGNYHLLSAALTARTGLSELEFAQKVLFGPLGISDIVWPTDPAGLSHGWGDLQLRPRDLAKIAFLMLHGGEWDGKRVVSRSWIAWSTAPRVKYGDDDYYGYGWWSHQGAPTGFYEAIGRGGQRLSVWPEKDVIVVMTGGGFRPDDIASFLLEALVADTALPRNPAGEAALSASLKAAATAPVAQKATMPACATAISGVTYSVAQNSLDLRHFSLEFPTLDSAVAHLKVATYELVLPVGMDGLYRTASTLVDGIAPSTRGTWRSPCELVLDLNLVGKIDRYTLAISFDATKAKVSIKETTGLVKETVSADAK